MGKKFQSRGAEREDQLRAITLATRAITPWAKPKKPARFSSLINCFHFSSLQ
jgi:hypothetical protein